MIPLNLCIFFEKKPGRLSAMGLGKLLTILDCFILNFKLKYEDSENIKKIV